MNTKEWAGDAGKMSRPIGTILHDLSESGEDYELLKREVIQKAIELGLAEKAINNNHRIAIAFLRGFLKGKQ